MTSFLRPDERSSQSRIEKNHQLNNTLKKTGASALGLAASITGAGIAARILPFFSELIPTEIALKGITSISPKLGGFLKKGMNQGLALKDGLNFLKNKFNPEENEEVPVHQEEDNTPKNLSEAERIVTLNKMNKGMKNPSRQEQEKERFEQQYGSIPQQNIESKAALQPQKNENKTSQIDSAILAALEKVMKL